MFLLEIPEKLVIGGWSFVGPAITVEVPLGVLSVFHAHGVEAKFVHFSPDIFH